MKNGILKIMDEMADHEAIKEICEQLEVNQYGQIKSTVNNYLAVMESDPLIKDAVRYNQLTEQAELTKKLWWTKLNRQLNDDDEDNLYAYFEIYYSLSNDKLMRKAIRITARSNQYHPIKELLESLEWDGEERIRHVLTKYLGTAETELNYQILLHFMLGAIERVYHPGCKFEEMLCLVGGQGAGKSTFFRFLALNDEWFVDDLSRIGDKNVYEKLCGHWIIEMSEMIGAINSKSVEELKSFLSRQKENYRTPYFRYSEDRLRQCVFAGTTNTGKFLPFDRSGARRFLPISVNSEKAEKHLLDDEEEARAYFRQMWAEAMCIYKSGDYSLKFSSEIEAKLEVQRMLFMQEDTYAGIIQGWLDECSYKYVCSHMIYKEALGKSLESHKKYETNEIVDIMNTKIAGWKEGPTHRFSEYGVQRSWIPADQAPSEDVNEPGREGFMSISDIDDGLPFM